MKVVKQLKHATFEYDEEKKVFTLYDNDGFNGTIELNKVYAFSFMRFVVRMAQKNWLKNPNKQKKVIDALDEDALQSDDIYQNPNQLEMFD